MWLRLFIQLQQKNATTRGHRSHKPVTVALSVAKSSIRDSKKGVSNVSHA